MEVFDITLSALIKSGEVPLSLLAQKLTKMMEHFKIE